LRIIKEKNVEYPSLYTTLVRDDKYNSSKLNGDKNSKTKMNNKHEQLFEALYQYGKKIKETTNLTVINEYLKTSLNKFVAIDEIVFFKISKSNGLPLPITAKTRESALNFIETIYRDGLLQKILERGNLSIITTRNKVSEVHNYYLVYPIIDIDRTTNHFVLIGTPEKHFESGTFTRKVLESFIQLFTPRAEYLLQKQDLSQTYDELQVYQSKLNNDYKLSAVGEMTYSLLDQIVSPMQVVLSCVDMLDSNNGNGEILSTIKSQIKKVQLITNNIVKFANGDQTKYAIIPCTINSFVHNYYDFIKGSLDKRNFEVFLDLDNNLPPILSTPNYINQILTNSFSLLVNTAETGGLYLQTKYNDQKVYVRFISTNNSNNRSDNEENKNLNLMMLETLMKKHEGSVNYNTSKDNGSSLELIFPLRRKLLK
jgi:signal transduction histidine kinase